MSHRSRSALSGLSTLALTVLVVGCGDYAPPSKPGAGGAGGSGQGTAGNTVIPGGGQAGSAAGAVATGGGGAGQGGTGGAAGSGGQGGAGGSGGVPMVGELPCPEPVPTDTTCGGDAKGTWAATSCPLTVTGEVNMMGLGLGCTAGTITSGSLKVTETWIAGDDGKYTDNTITTGMQEIELPPSCLTVSGFVTTCDRVSDPFAGTLGYASVACVDNAETGGCTCQATIEQKGGLAFVSLASPDKGAFATATDTLTMTSEQVDTQYSYCVAGDTMTMTVKTEGKAGTVMGPIVLKKQ